MSQASLLAGLTSLWISQQFFNCSPSRGPRVARRDPQSLSPPRSFSQTLSFSFPDNDNKFTSFTVPTPQGSVQGAGFTGVSQTFDTAGLDSLFTSFSSEFTKTTEPGAGSRTTSDLQTTTGSGATSTGTSNTASPASSTTFATSASRTPGGSEPATTSLNGYTSGTATNAASNTSGAVTVSEKSLCNGISCSSALQAAVAVPVVVAAIAAIFLFFCCARRTRKRAGAVVSENRPPRAGKMKWTRHLRAFSFDAELLMGGRFSSSNSLRSRDPSVRSAATASGNGAHSAEPSMHGVEEVAPPYRAAISHATHPSSPPRLVPAAAASLPTQRPSSTTTAPPPYRSAALPEPRNPLSNSAPVSPIEGSPFNDPPEAGCALAPSALSRGSSMYRSVVTDDAATPTASEAGSIREAIVGRRVSAGKRGARAVSTSGGSS